MITRMFTREYWPYVAIVASALALAVAHLAESIGNLYPCPLCLRQREIYWAVLGVGIVGLAWRRLWPASRIPFAHCMIIGATCLTGVCIASYHAGVEWGFFTAGCTAEDFDPGAFDPSMLEQSMPTGDCGEPPIVILGLSMAGWNALTYLGMAITSFLAASNIMRRYGQSADPTHAS